MSNKRDGGENSGIKNRPKNFPNEQVRKSQIKKKKIKKKKKSKKIKKIIFFILCAMIILVVGSMGYLFSFLGDLNNNNLPKAIPANSKEPVNILVVGTDIGDAENKENTSLRRTDSIMLVNYNPNTEKMHIVSIPRDTMIEYDAYLGNEFRRYWKINNACVLNGEDELINQVEKILSVRINNMVVIDYAAFRNLIDVIGPIPMNIKQDMFYDDDAQNLHINFKGGETVQLDGKKAEEFFRWRKNNDGTGLVMGDIDRIKNQHEFISNVIDKCMTPSIIFKVPDILKSVSDNIKTNLTSKDIMSLGLKGLRLNKEDIIMTTLNGTSENVYGESFFIANKEGNKDLINSLNAVNAKDAPNTSIDKKDLKIMILNATNTNGLAGDLKEQLTRLGYENISVGNASQQNKSIIQLNNKEIEDALTADTDIMKVGSIKDSEYEQYDAVIILGGDYKVFGN